ncbi:MAG: TetR/AcrR family transcriptional regulator [Actinomycetes bacterium]
MSTRTRRSSERRAELQAAAQRAMAEYGTEVQLNQVAREAGLTSGAVLYHYPDLKDLLLDAQRAGMERFYDARLTALEGIDDPVERLVVTIASGLPSDIDDSDVRLLCELGGAAARNPVYGALLTTLFDRQVAMYQVILEAGSARGLFGLSQDSLVIARTLVALEDAYGYRIMARHPNIGYASAVELVMTYARLATGHALPYALPHPSRMEP